MSGTYYIPSNDGQFDVFFNNIVEYVLARVLVTTPVWTHISSAEAQKLATSCTAWQTAYEPTKVPHSPVVTAEKNRVRKVSQKALEEFVNRYLRYLPVTDEDRDRMGIPNHKEGRTPVPLPTTCPQLTVDTGTRRRLLVHYQDEGATRRGKPKNVHVIEVRWAILDHPPEDIEKELVHSSFDTNPPLTLSFGEEDRGKRVYMAGAWEIEREGEKGPYGAIVEAIIP
jgi:hypothetical protein